MELLIFSWRFPLSRCSGSTTRRYEEPGKLMYDLLYRYYWGLPREHKGKEPSCQCRTAGDVGPIAAWERSPGGGNGHPLQYSCWDNPKDRGDWRALVHGVAKSQTRLSTHVCMHRYHRGLILRVMLCFPPEDPQGASGLGIPWDPGCWQSRSSPVAVLQPVGVSSSSFVLFSFCNNFTLYFCLLMHVFSIFRSRNGMKLAEVSSPPYATCHNRKWYVIVSARSQYHEMPSWDGDGRCWPLEKGSERGHMFSQEAVSVTLYRQKAVM